VVIAHGESPRGAIADIEALGCLVITAAHVREAELRAAGVERALAASCSVMTTFWLCVSG